MIPIPLIVAAVLTAGAVLAVALPLMREHLLSSELRRDWWPDFEREFRAYASRPWQEAREAEQRS